MELTSTEKEMIRLKRVEDEAKEQQKLLQDQLEYEKLLKEQESSISIKIKSYINGNERMTEYYNKLVELGCGEHIELKTKNRTITYDSYNSSEIKPEDVISKEQEIIFIHTKFGDIDGIDLNNTTRLPYKLSSRYQGYTASGCARKILEVVEQEKIEKQSKQKRESNREALIKQFKEKYPNTKFELKEEYKHSNHSKGTGWYNYYLTVRFPNGSWAKIRYNETQWALDEKFDSKYIKPETKEEWLDYLAKD